MRIQLSSLRALILVVGITVLAESVSGENDDGLRTEKIVGGRIPTKSAHPYMVIVQRRLAGGKVKRCGGTLIDKKLVLTAGHCVDREDTTVIAPSRIRVKVGAFRLDQPDKYEKTIFVEDITRHSEYNHDTARHDIALLKLKEEATIDGFRVKTAPLPDGSTQFHWANCKTAGWGATSGAHRNILSNVLMEAHMALTSIGECQSHWGKKDISLRYNVCAIDQQSRSSPCDGDSGGPLMCFDGRTGKHVLAGVTSWADEFCNPKYPSVFMKVSAYKDWITDNK